MSVTAALTPIPPRTKTLRVACLRTYLCVQLHHTPRVAGVLQLHPPLRRSPADQCFTTPDTANHAILVWYKCFRRILVTRTRPLSLRRWVNYICAALLGDSCKSLVPNNQLFKVSAYSACCQCIDASADGELGHGYYARATVPNNMPSFQA